MISIQLRLSSCHTKQFQLYDHRDHGGAPAAALEESDVSEAWVTIEEEPETVSATVAASVNSVSADMEVQCLKWDYVYSTVILMLISN